MLSLYRGHPQQSSKWIARAGKAALRRRATQFPRYDHRRTLANLNHQPHLPNSKFTIPSPKRSSSMGNSKSRVSGNPQVKKIIDKVWDRFASTSEGDDESLDVQDLYCAILLIYNDINKTLPGPHNEPPTKEEILELLRANDKDDDGRLNRYEFTAFIETFTKNVSVRVGTNVLLFSFVIPTVVSLSRPRVEQLPGVGPIVKKTPPPIYSAVMTTLIVFFGSQFTKK